MAISIWHDFIKIELESRCNLKMFRLISAENGNKKTQGYRKWNEIKVREMCICDVCVCVCRGKGGRFWLVDRGGGGGGPFPLAMRDMTPGVYLVTRGVTPHHLPYSHVIKDAMELLPLAVTSGIRAASLLPNVRQEFISRNNSIAVSQFAKYKIIRVVNGIKLIHFYQDFFVTAVR